MNDFFNKLMAFKIIREKLDEVHENILTALNSGFADFPDSKARTYWERSDIMTLATLDKRIEDDKHLVSGFIRELKKGAKFYEVSY